MKYFFKFFEIYGKYFYRVLGILCVVCSLYLFTSDGFSFPGFYSGMIGIFILIVDSIPSPRPDETHSKKIRVICKDGVWYLQQRISDLGLSAWVDYAKSDTEEDLEEKLEELKNKIYNPENGTTRYY